MFRRIRPIADPVSLRVDSREVLAERGDSVAAALLSAGVTVFRRTPLTASPRAPLCMQGSCFDCRLEIDGQPDQRACRIRVREGMVVRTQRISSAGEPDVS